VLRPSNIGHNFIILYLANGALAPPLSMALRGTLRDRLFSLLQSNNSIYLIATSQISINVISTMLLETVARPKYN
jgi:hypothetical protein